MDNKALLVEGLGKKYFYTKNITQSKQQTAIHQIGNNISTIEKKEGDFFWALKDISFELNRGDILGVIGQNGSGKSTLLKILSDIVKPTEGKVFLNGNVASILEVGTGFHPDLTGRENIFFSGSLLGISNDILQSRETEIINFSGISSFIDMPVKHYSSGMHVRLATAIIFHIDVSLLLLDEVFFVGDAEFRYKIIPKIEELINRQTTLIIVSHNMNEIVRICNKCLIMDAGRMIDFGDPAEKVNQYVKQATKNVDRTVEQYWDSPEVAPGNDIIRLRQVNIYARGKGKKEKIFQEDEVMVDIEYWKLSKDDTVELMITVIDRNGAPALVTSVIWNKNEQKVYGLFKEEVGLFKISCSIPNHLLTLGNYSIQLRFGHNTTFLESKILYTHPHQFPFDMERNPNVVTEKFLDDLPVSVHVFCSWEHVKI